MYLLPKTPTRSHTILATMGSSKESTKPKKEKSSKKRKSEALAEVEVEAEVPASEEVTVEAKPKKEKSSKKRKSEVSAEETAEEKVSVPEAVTTEAKPKKDKSNKKRKAETLVEAEVPVPETVTSEQEDVPAPADIEMEVEVEGEEVTENPEDPANPPSKKRKVIPASEEIEVDITAPEPPSKKALRALKKGKPLPPSKSGAENTPEPEEKKAKKAEVEKRSEHGIWIGNMAFHTSKEDLRTFLVEKSDLTEDMVTRIHMPGPNDNKSANKVPTNKWRVDHNKGFAYVDFSTAKGVEYALELSEELLSGRRVLIKDNKSFEGRPDKTKEEQRKEGKPPSKRVFVGNLSFDTTEESLTEHFFKCGPIESMKVATFEDSGKCKGYAWIVFEELSAAESAVKGHVMVEDEASDVSSSEDSDSDSDSNSDSEAAPKPKKASKAPKKGKMRKWWINKIKGRPLRMEFAEDAQVRYKKRYGKDGTKNPNSINPNSRDDNAAPRARQKREEKSGGGGGEGEAKTSSGPKVVEYRNEYAPRLTGGIVESKGSKTKF